MSIENKIIYIGVIGPGNNANLAELIEQYKILIPEEDFMLQIEDKFDFSKLIKAFPYAENLEDEPIISTKFKNSTNKPYNRSYSSKKHNSKSSVCRINYPPFYKK